MDDTQTAPMCSMCNYRGFDQCAFDKHCQSAAPPVATPTEPVQTETRDAARGIYIASRASLPERSARWRKLRSEGVRITSSWIDEAGEGQTDSFTELWRRIETEIRDSSGVMLFAESGDFPLKGALIEAGIALGMGKRVVVVLPGVELEPRSQRPIGSWIAHPLVSKAATVEEAVERLSPTPPVADVPSGDTELDGWEELHKKQLEFDKLWDEAIEWRDKATDYKAKYEAAQRTIAELEVEHEERDVFSERVEKERDDALDRAESAELSDRDRAALADYARQLGCTCAYLKPYYDVKHELRCTLHTPEAM